MPHWDDAKLFPSRNTKKKLTKAERKKIGYWSPIPQMDGGRWIAICINIRLIYGHIRYIFRTIFYKYRKQEDE